MRSTHFEEGDHSSEVPARVQAPKTTSVETKRGKASRKSASKQR